MTAGKRMDRERRVNLGAFYTPKRLADTLKSMALWHVPRDVLARAALLDSSCGSGNLLASGLPVRRMIGADVDPEAVAEAKSRLPTAEISCRNSLELVRREDYGIGGLEPLIVMSNPPYNDRTSFSQRTIRKAAPPAMAPSVASSDLGIAFMLSYNELEANWVLALHPLSYLVKKANFHRLKRFFSNYALEECLVVSSEEFNTGSRYPFPIALACYRRSGVGTSWDFIRSYPFPIDGGKRLILSELDPVSNYVDKYPNRKRVRKEDSVAMFYTLRDINALRRSRTFIERETESAVYVTREQYPLFCYLDAFRKFQKALPYWLGNCEPFIDTSEFWKIADDFTSFRETGRCPESVREYFARLFSPFL